MHVTIMAPDNLVLVDGEARPVQCDDLMEAGVRVVQWYDTFGHIEYDNPPGTREFKCNTDIDDLSPYKSYVDAWEAYPATPIVLPGT